MQTKDNTVYIGITADMAEADLFLDRMTEVTARAVNDWMEITSECGNRSVTYATREPALIDKWLVVTLDPSLPADWQLPAACHEFPVKIAGFEARATAVFDEFACDDCGRKIAAVYALELQ